MLNLSYLSHSKVFSFRHDLGHYSRTQYFQNQFKGLIKPSSGRVSPPTVHHGMFDHGSQEIWRSETFLQVWMWQLRNRRIKIFGGIWFERVSGGWGCWGNNYYFIINKPFNAPCHKGGKGEDIVRRHSHARVFGWSWSLHNITNYYCLWSGWLFYFCISLILDIIQRFEDIYVKESKPFKLNLKAIIKWPSFNK